MDYEAAEDKIILVLAPLVTAGCEVVAFPDTQSEAQKTISKPRITVAWNGTDIQASQSTASVVQTSTVSFEVTIQWKKKRGATGVYAIMKLIKIYLLGLDLEEIVGAGKMYLTKEEFADYDTQNVWNFRMLFSVYSMEIETASSEADIILSQLNFNTEPVANA